MCVSVCLCICMINILMYSKWEKTHPFLIDSYDIRISHFNTCTQAVYEMIFGEFDYVIGEIRP